MIRRKGPILAVAVIAAFALGWYRGLFGVEPVPQTEAPRSVIPNGATPSSPTPEGSSSNAGGTPAASGNNSQATPETASGAAIAPNAPNAPNASAGVQAIGSQPQPQALSAANGPPPAATTPGFDVVRVEPDGSTVVAGKGKANEAIALTDGTRTFGEARTDANGDFVMSLSLPQGSHRLQLAQRDDTVSDDAAVVNVPPTGKPDELLVMMQRPGEASEIIQRPSEQAAAPAIPEATSPAVKAPTDTQEPADTVAAAAPAPAPSNVAGKPDTAAQKLGVDAVEIEGDRLFVAGSAKERTTVRVYLDDQPIAEATSGAGERYIASARADVAVGEHAIRVDALDTTGRVVGRVEVPFQRPEGNAMAAIAAAPKPEGANTATPGSNAADAPASPSSGIAPGGIASVQPTPASPSAMESTSQPSPSSSPAAPPAAPSAPSIEPSRQADGNSPNVAAAPTDGAASDLEPPTVRQAPLEAAASRVIIRRGDTLWRISRQTYGRGNRYTVIYLANGDQIRDPNRIYPGQVFRVPDDTPVREPPRG